MTEQDHPEVGLSLEELSEISGVEPRTLRSWVSEGMLSPPLKPGRGAKYPSSNADRALAVKVLKEVHGLSFSEIGRKFILESEDKIREWALEARSIPAVKDSALNYLRRVELKNQANQPLQSPPVQRQLKSIESHTHANEISELTFSSSNSTDNSDHFRGQSTVNTAIEQLIMQLQEILGAPAPRRSRGSIWTRISVTPDLEISVRGEFQPQERVLFEQLADHFRIILTGGSNHDKNHT